MSNLSCHHMSVNMTWLRSTNSSSLNVVKLTVKMWSVHWHDYCLYVLLSHCCEVFYCNKMEKLTVAWSLLHTETRSSSGDEIANVNFLYDDIVHALQYTIDSYINSATDRRHNVLERRFTKVSEITQCNGHYAGHSRLPTLVPIESSYTTCY